MRNFENLYILTYDRVYRLACVLVKDEAKAIDLLKDVYVYAYHNQILDMREDEIWPWIQEIIYQQADISHEIESVLLENEEQVSLSHLLSEDKATTIFMEIEERLGIPADEEEPNLLRTRMLTAGKVVLALFAVLVAWKIIAIGFDKGKTYITAFQQMETAAMFETQADVQDIKKISEETDQLFYLADQKVVLSPDGEIVSVEAAGEDGQYQEAIQQDGEWTYYLVNPNNPNDQLENADEDLEHVLFRVKNLEDRMIEVISEDVEDYFVWNQRIYYLKEGILKKAEAAASYRTQNLNYHVKADEEAIYLYDFLGNAIHGEVQLADRIYEMDGGKIVQVTQKVETSDGTRFYLDDWKDSGIWQIWRTGSGITDVFSDEEYGVDSFCMADQWIYYSTPIGEDSEGVSSSKIYRMSLDGSQKQEVHGSFPGKLVKMYYFQEQNEIYGEYQMNPSENGYGKIAVLTLDGQMSYLEDSDERAIQESTGNDRLKLVIAEDTDVYCLWEDFENSGEDEPLWSRPLVLSNRTRIFMK